MDNAMNTADTVCTIELPNGTTKAGFPAGQDISNPGHRCVVSQPKGPYGRRTTWSAPADKVREFDVTADGIVWAVRATRAQVRALRAAGLQVRC